MPGCAKVQVTPCASLRTLLYLKGEDAQLERLDNVWLLCGACVDADLLWWVVRFCRERAWFEEMRTAVCRAGRGGVLCLQFALERFRKRIMDGAEGWIWWRLATGNMGYMEVLFDVLETSVRLKLFYDTLSFKISPKMLERWLSWEKRLTCKLKTLSSNPHLKKKRALCDCVNL